MQIKKQFIKFLKYDGVYFMYRQNWRANPYYTKIPYVECYVSWPFMWVPAKYGSRDLWNDLNSKWIRHLESIGYKK